VARSKAEEAEKKSQARSRRLRSASQRRARRGRRSLGRRVLSIRRPRGEAHTIVGQSVPVWSSALISIVFMSRARCRASCCAGPYASGPHAASANNSIAFDPTNLAPSDAAAFAEVGQALKQSPWPTDQGFDARLFGAHFHNAAERSSIFVAKLFPYEFGEEHRVSINHGHPECGSSGAPSLFPPPSIRNKPPLSRV